MDHLKFMTDSNKYLHCVASRVRIISPNSQFHHPLSVCLEWRLEYLGEIGGGRGEAGMIILLVLGIVLEIGMEEVLKTRPGIVYFVLAPRVTQRHG